MSTVRIVQYGVGAMGRNMVRLLRRRPRALVVGAIDHDPAKIGRDLGDVAGLGESTGVMVSHPSEGVLDKIEADLILHSTTAFLDEAFDQIVKALERRCHVVTICQELFFPIGKNRMKANMLDSIARERGVAVTAVGINPGFIMDIVPIVCSLPCWEIRNVFASRVVDFGPYGPDEMRHIGAGLSPADFQEGVQRGDIGHIGLLESAAMTAHCLKMGIDELRQNKSPVVAVTERSSEYVTVPSGRVCGFRQKVEGFRQGERCLEYSMTGIVNPLPAEDGVELGDYTRIEGEPSVDVRISKEIAQKGGLGTAGVAVNMIPKIMEAKPGFHTMNRLTVPHIWGDKEDFTSIKRISYC